MYNQSQSPPPLRHPVPTHPTFIPEPPQTPGTPDGYQRFSSSPGPAPAQPHQLHPAYGAQSVPAYSSYQPPPVPNNPYASPPQVPPQQNFGQFAQWAGVDTATAQLGLQLGNSAVQAGQDYVQKNFGAAFPLPGLKHKFNVSNLYVLNKLKLVIFPWRHRPWSRRALRSEQGAVEWSPPRDDVNSPDLYIPVMALVTYILISAFFSGLKNNFHPKVLGESLSSALAVVIVEFCFIYLACYFLNIQGTSQALDIIAYTGYKFVGVIATILANFLKPSRTVWAIIFLYFFSANAFFLLRSLRSLVLKDPASSTAATISPAARKRRIMFLFLEAGCQLLYMGFLVRV
ncbi:YIF1-domain-containing protein [Cylindrobasidium torrendii FP15055 ss-10]|uniref:Protein YIF1 n=1 Tax=Cylindrobasidium torrendii FP15055 ss-10 TaxID=1314674 RepID=A0A0D7B7W7_9AGAR|nr:YIF1-domain-containing protein [Cylindrobasidium torrendii FP15055 ss-10]